MYYKHKYAIYWFMEVFFKTRILSNVRENEIYFEFHELQDSLFQR